MKSENVQVRFCRPIRRLTVQVCNSTFKDICFIQQIFIIWTFTPKCEKKQAMCRLLLELFYLFRPYYVHQVQQTQKNVKENIGSLKQVYQLHSDIKMSNGHLECNSDVMIE